jgi:polysaccharide pyruvyl transferase WcaK-like protein
LIGIGGVYNYGCEAIVRGTERILRSGLPDAEIAYFSSAPAEDARRLSGCRVDVQPRYRSGLDRIARRIVNKPFRSLRLTPPLDLERSLRGGDLVLSIGGDMYTQYGGNMPRSIMGLGNKVMRAGIPYAVWGASIGPFNGPEGKVQELMEHFRRCRFITVREDRTLDYLRRQGVEQNVFRVADPAFALGEADLREAAIPPGGRRLRIGINFSPLSAAEVGMDRDQMAAGQGAMLGRLVERTDADLLLLPHVVSTVCPGDDDLGYLRQVQAAIPVAVRARVRLVDNDPGFLGLKPLLRACDVVLAARMHCGINAVSEGRPALFLAYSEKARGMAERVYGHGRYVLDVRDSGQRSFADALCDLLPRLQAENLAGRAKEWKDEALQTLRIVASAWNGLGT